MSRAMYTGSIDVHPLLMEEENQPPQTSPEHRRTAAAANKSRAAATSAALPCAIVRQAHGAAADVLAVMRDKARMLPLEIFATIAPEISSSDRLRLGLLHAASARNSPHRPCNLRGHHATRRWTRASGLAPCAASAQAMRDGAVVDATSILFRFDSEK
ncbi:photosynthetic NDH subunit of subcomplex B 1, chloroplastic [Dorcoceras hygrometricum]|uniref:Photosynthetic NDH subunit of subcomplex B 1, chloroplastic n=1 Tax=Dorcoceras hygrometricum TaxID=472368 RepID=A0A2Z7DKS8_9LAMI|nr:photosynthetic NDH subunit of subcomplex B 1, chloroplastic [Dorcoceras hygrometricum]